ncbi:MAG: tetratricopeptide repeat protein [Magnetovibrionaceae bacterium]
MSEQDLIERAKEHIAAKRFAEADALARDVLRDNAEDTRALHIRGFVALNLGQPAMALELLRKADAFGSENPLLFMHLGAAEGMIGNRPAAISAFDRALELVPTLAEAHQNKGLALIGEGRMEEAVFAFEAAELNGAGPQASSGRGQALFELGRFAEAKEAFQKALDEDAGSFEILVNMGHTMLALAENEDALKTFERADNAKPFHPAVMMGLAKARAATGDIKGAKGVLKTLLGRKPGWEPAQDLLAEIEFGASKEPETPTHH